MHIFTRNWKFIAALTTLGIVREVMIRRRMLALEHKVVLITGGARGLGLALAKVFAREQSRLILCARDEQELQRAQHQLETDFNAEVMAIVCDVTVPSEVQQMIEQATARFGGIDILVNNAGIISAGPWRTLTRHDFEEAMDSMFWGVYNTTMALLPQMQERKGGRIVNITSIGGKVSVPHLLAYSSAKFAAVGFSEGLQAELARDGIAVTTVVPGLMRTGSHVNTTMKGETHRIEYTLFSLLDTIPLFSISAQRAAQQIVRATRRGQAELIISIQAQLLARLHGAFPELINAIFTLTNRFLPDGKGQGTVGYAGHESETPITRSFITVLGQKATRNYNETCH